MTTPALSNADRRHLTVRHTTRFQYNEPIQHSSHRVHLRPIDDACQTVVSYQLKIAPAQSDASHAWLQLYIPEVGWRGFDPTNGVLASINHIRVAYGRHYRDAAPTAGTLYSLARENMTIDVQVVES